MSNKNTNPFKNEDVIKEEENFTEENTEETKEEAEEVCENSDNKLQEEYDKLNQQYIRLAADFDNYRKRQEQERESLIKFGTENALKNLLEILDNFERGEKALENVEEIEKVKESFNLIHKQVFETLSKMGLEEIKAVGEEFDPNYHEAVMQTPTSEHPEHTVIAELQKGYKVGDKVLRATLVNVATAE
jgi:molecular chaperone GrpE